MKIRSQILFLVFAILAIIPAGMGQEGGSNGVIRSWDEVEIRVFQEEDLTTRGQLGADGSLTMPLVGAVRLAGMTQVEAAAQIAARLRDGYLANPQVTVTVQGRVRRTISVFGEVQNPGVYEIPHHRPITLVEAIGLAGGLTRIADGKNITLKRGNAGPSKHNFKALTTGQSGQDVILREGDVITVPEGLF